jgi:hypothetical protein
LIKPMLLVLAWLKPVIDKANALGFGMAEAVP